MKVTLIRRSNLLIAIFIMACALSFPIQGFAQGRGHGRGLDKKAVKFVNGHDARDGRWDGRGPRPRFARSIWDGTGYRYRNRNWRKRGHKHRGAYRAYRR
jgi:hypothetical protein